MSESEISDYDSESVAANTPSERYVQNKWSVSVGGYIHVQISDDALSNIGRILSGKYFKKKSTSAYDRKTSVCDFVLLKFMKEGVTSDRQYQSYRLCEFHYRDFNTPDNAGDTFYLDVDQNLLTLFKNRKNFKGTKSWMSEWLNSEYTQTQDQSFGYDTDDNDDADDVEIDQSKNLFSGISGGLQESELSPVKATGKLGLGDYADFGSQVTEPGTSICKCMCIYYFIKYINVYMNTICLSCF